MAREATGPTYEKDTVGDICRPDERDIVFAREELFRCFGPGSVEFETYYGQRPEFLELDTRISRMPSRRRTGGIDNPMYKALFSHVDKISPQHWVDGNPAGKRVVVPPARAQEKVKAIARHLGADLVGTGPLRQEWVYSHVGRSHGNDPDYQQIGAPIDLSHHNHSIALGFRMDYDLLQGAPEFPQMLGTAKAYTLTASAAVQLADYIRLMGYSARAHHLFDYKVLCVPIAIDCGLGELSRAGYMLTREFGLGVRLSTVTTNMPLAHDAPIDIAAQSFCRSCKVCADNCPVGAIATGEKAAHNGVMKWRLDSGKCFTYWHTKGTSCGICMAVCPWTRPDHWLHGAMARLAARRGSHQGLMASVDRYVRGDHTIAAAPDYLESAGER